MAASTQKKTPVKRKPAAKRKTPATRTTQKARTTRKKGVRKSTSRKAAPKRPPVRRDAGRVSVLELLRESVSRFYYDYGREIGLVTLMILTLCDFLSLPNVFAKAPTDGILVGWISILFRGLFGYGYMMSLVALPLALLILWRREDSPVFLPVACTLVLPFLFGMLGHLLLPGASLTKSEGLLELLRSLWITGQALASGGVLSGGLAELCRAFFSQFVALVLLLLVLYWVSSHLEIRREGRPRGYVYDDRLEDDYPDYSPDDEPDIGIGYERGPGIRERLSGWLDGFRRAPEAYEEPEPKPKPVRLKKPPVKKLPPKKAEKKPVEVEPEPEAVPEPPPPPPKEKKSKAKPKKAESGIKEEARSVTRDISREMSHDMGDYISPPVSILVRNPNQGQREDRAELARNAKRLEETLTSFDVNAVSAGEAVRGPSITRYEFRLEQGVKLSKIMNLADDIALSLGSSGVRIAPIQNRKSVVGIEVPNAVKTPVLLRDVVESPEFLRRSSATTFALGKDISGDIVTGAIEDLPHVLIAGTTGSGKSVCTNSMIISLLYKSSPEQLRFIMIDPKMVELAPYNGIPHLLIPVVTDPRKAAGALQWAVTEMMRRYKAFSENGVKKLSEYQRLLLKKKELPPLPSVVVVIDELADLMMVAAKEVEESIMRVAQMGRAAGMHLVIATQRPSADVITGLMKANIPSRIAFAVASAMESRIILDSAGAEKLVGNGDMLYAPLGGEKKRVQGCYVSPEEIEKVVAFVKGERETRYDDNVLATIDAAVSGQDKPAKAEPEPVEQQDDLLPAAVDVVLETGQASTSMLQRRLKLGYSRASRLIDQMERRGYVGPFEGSRPRQLLITKEQWQELRAGVPLSRD
ncbi:MAG: DNA translocase FtsK [Oscillibacter sp.]|nr:DNA translocase FtsK [Oscillibacter sp.]